MWILTARFSSPATANTASLIETEKPTSPLANFGVSEFAAESVNLSLMSNASEKAGPIRQIKPPPLSQHLRELASRPHAWAVIARNLIPVVGIYGFGWSAGLTVFNYCSTD